MQHSETPHQHGTDGGPSAHDDTHEDTRDFGALLGAALLPHVYVTLERDSITGHNWSLHSVHTTRHSAVEALTESVGTSRKVWQDEHGTTFVSHALDYDTPVYMIYQARLQP